MARRASFVGTLCGAFAIFTLGTGCDGIPAPDACEVDADCADDDGCTTNTCVAGLCNVDTMDCDDGLACNGVETCDDGVCVDGDALCDEGDLCDEDTDDCAECFEDADCDNGDFCDGAETCVDNACVDGDAECTGADETCDEDADACVDVCTDDASCDDSVFCNGAETCGDDGLCANGDAPCAADQVCDEEGGACNAQTVDFSVTLNGCPAASASTNQNIDMSASPANAVGAVTCVWTATGGASVTGDDDDDSCTVTVNTGATAGTVSVTGTDDNDTADDDTDDFSATGDLCSISVQPPTINVNAGADVAVNAAFPAGATVTVTNITSGVTAIGDDTAFDDTEIIFNWEVISAPTGVDAGTDVIITNTSNPALTFRMLPITSANQPVLQPTGLTTVQNNSAIPGPYGFRITATNPAGDSATDDVTISVFPAFDADVTGGSLTGLAVVNGSLTDYTTTGSSINLAFQALIAVDSTIQFNLEDLSATPDPDQLLNAVTVTGSGAAQEITCEVTGVTTPGTYDVEAGFQEATGLVSTAPSAAAGTTQYDVHIQRDPLPATIDPDNLMLIDSNLVNSVHGGDDDSGGNFAGVIAAIAADIDGDGNDELLYTDGTTVVAVWMLPDVTTASPFNNAQVHSGEWLNTATGSTTTPLTATTQVTATAAAVRTLAACDIDGDNDLDLVLGMPGDNSLDGQVEIWKADITTTIAFSGDRYDGTVDSQITQTDTDAAFGYSLACGNVGSNTSEDIVVGAPSADWGGTGLPGAVHVFYGGAGAFSGNIAVTQTGGGANVFIHEIDGQSGSEDFFGISICLAELNAQSPLDIVIGGPGVETDDNGDATVTDGGEDAEGAIFAVFGGGSTGIVTNFDRRYDGSGSNMLLGRRVVCGDFNADTRDDIFASYVGAVTSAAAQGGILFINGTQGSAVVSNSTTFPRVTGSTAGDNLGAELAMGDVNGDGILDLIASMPEDSDDDGQIRVYYGGTTVDLTADLTLNPVELDQANDVNLLSTAAASTAIVCGAVDCDDELIDYLGDERWMMVMDIDGNGAGDLLFKCDGAGGADTQELGYLLQSSSTQAMHIAP